MRAVSMLTALLVTGIGLLTPNVRAGAEDVTTGAGEASINRTIAANPGSVRLSDDRIQLEPGVVLDYRTGDAQPLGEHGCADYYFCLYVDSYYEGPMLQFYDCGRYGLEHYYFWNPGDPNRHDFADDVSSVYNAQTVTGQLEFGWGGNMNWAPMTSSPLLRGDYNDRGTVAQPC